MILNNNHVDLRRLKYYFIISIVYGLTIFINNILNLDQNKYSIVLIYSHFSIFILLGELAFKICYVPDTFECIIITETLIIWRCLSQLEIIDGIFNISYKIIINTNILIISFVVVALFFQAYNFPNTRFQTFVILCAEVTNIYILIVLVKIDTIHLITIHRWQIFYFALILFPEKKYRIVYSSLFGMMISEIASYGLQPPYI